MPDAIEVSPEGYVDDFGAPYASNGALTYGWVLPGTLTPVDASANTRNRNNGNTIDDSLLNTLTIVGSANPAFPTRDWVLNLPNGYYNVNISVGDITATDSNHQIEVNGVNVIDFDQENNNPENLVNYENRELVQVTDGILRLAANPLGNNAKLNYIQVGAIRVNGDFKYA